MNEINNIDQPAEEGVAYREDKTEGEVLKHKWYVLKESLEGTYIVWGKDEYERYIKAAVRLGAAHAVKIIIGFNGNEDYLFPSQPTSKEEEEKFFENGETYPGKECGLSYEEWLLETIVLRIKNKTILEGIGILRKFSAAQSRDGEIAGLNETINNQHKLMINAEQRGMDKVKEELAGIAVKFAEWIRDERYIQSTINPNIWYQYPYKEKSDYFTTQELFNLFKTNKP